LTNTGRLGGFKYFHQKQMDFECPDIGWKMGITSS